jgi:hypothetical protein
LGRIAGGVASRTRRGESEEKGQEQEEKGQAPVTSTAARITTGHVHAELWRPDLR